MRLKLMLISLAFVLGGCNGTQSRKSELSRFMRYMKEGDFAHVTAMETGDCDDALSLKKLRKMPASYPESEYGKMHDTIEENTKYTLENYVTGLKVLGESRMGNYVTVKTKAYVLDTVGFSSVLRSKAYQKILQKTIKKNSKDLNSAIKKNDSDKALLICYNAMAKDVGKLMKKNVDETSKTSEKIDFTFTPNGQISDIEVE